MRAAVFVNLVAMHKAMDAHDNGHLKMSRHNLEILQKANYLFHSAHNCFSALAEHASLMVVWRRCVVTSFVCNFKFAI